MSKSKFFLMGICIILDLFLVSVTQAKPKILPIVNLRISGGSADYTGKDEEKVSSSFDGDFSLDLVPVVKFSESLSLLPRYSGSYTGAGRIMDLEDEEILYQQSIDNLFSLRLIYTLSPGLKFKSEYGFKKELVRETKDESWNGGLYDYNNSFVSLEMEKRFSQFLIGGGSRIYTLRFPNYRTIAAEDLPGGKDVLDNNNYDIFVGGDILLGQGSLLRWNILSTHSYYIDKKVFIDLGEKANVYSSDKRIDNIFDFNCGLTYPLGGEQYKTFFGFDLGLKRKDSNQNYLDNLKLISDFYDYNQVTIVPSFTVKSLIQDITINVSWEWARKRYPNRIASTVNFGGSDKYGVDSYIQLWRLGFLYPLSKAVSLDTSFNWRNSSSGIDYNPEKYNFETYSYLVGISYEY